MNLLSADRIRESIGGDARSHLQSIEVFSELESTNSYLLEQPCPGIDEYRVALAEFQTAGRGRMNRRWCSPRSSGLCLSISYAFRKMPDQLPSLSLAIGCSIAEALQRFGVHDIGLKWPNDIVVRNRKICGILSEVANASTSGVAVVTGIGLNVDLSDAKTGTSSDTGGMIDLASCCDELPSRCEIAAVLIERSFHTMRNFATDGFSRFQPAWDRFDWLRGRQVKIETGDGLVAGVADGVDTDGALLLNSGSAIRRFTSGSVILDNYTVASE